jgi:hypothetical protein
LRTGDLDARQVGNSNEFFEKLERKRYWTCIEDVRSRPHPGGTVEGGEQTTTRGVWAEG